MMIKKTNNKIYGPVQGDLTNLASIVCQIINDYGHICTGLKIDVPKNLIEFETTEII